MSERRAIKAAISLVSASPPQSRAESVRRVVRLREASTGTHVSGEFVEALLVGVHQRLRIVTCANTAKGCERTFVASEYNRDGNAFRCPYCSKYTLPQQGLVADDVAYPYVKDIRVLEKQFMAAFHEYTFLYYGSQAALTCSVWPSQELDHDLGIAILIANEVEVSADDGTPIAHDHPRDDPSAIRTCVWNSTHRILYSSARGIATCHSTIYLDVFSGMVRLSGFHGGGGQGDSIAEQQNTSSLSVPRLEDLLAVVGTHIQDLENRRRGTMVGIGFHKASQVVAILNGRPLSASTSLDAHHIGGSASATSDHHHQQQHHAAVQQAGMHQMLGHPQEEGKGGIHPATVTVPPMMAPAKPKEEKEENTASLKLPSLEEDDGEDQHPNVPDSSKVHHHGEEETQSKEVVTQRGGSTADAIASSQQATTTPAATNITDWVATQDEEGNVFYYNEITGETSWEPPEGWHSASNGSGGDDFFRSTLQSLNLSEAVDIVADRLASVGITSIETLIDKGASQELLVEAGFGAFGDRRKITKWIQNHASS